MRPSSTFSTAFCLTLLPSLASAAPLCPDVDPSTSAMGMNLARVHHFDSPQWLLVDAFAQSSPWYAYSPSQGWVPQPQFPTDADGWPNGTFGDEFPFKYMFHNSGGTHPSGTWLLQWDGTGATVLVDGDAHDAQCEDGAPIWDCPSGRAQFEVTPTDEGITVLVIPWDMSTYGSTPDYVSDIRVLMPGGVCGRASDDLDLAQPCATARGGTGICDLDESCYDFDEVAWDRHDDPIAQMNDHVVFHPRTLELLAPFTTVRFSEPTEVNDSQITSWSQRSQVTQHSFSLEDSGLPYEYILAIANQLDIDPWFNIPHLADDAFVDSLAAMADAGVETGRSIYVEYTNEHWNYGYAQALHMADMAADSGAGAALPVHLRPSVWYAERAVELVDRWRAASSSPERVYGVLGAHMASPDHTTAMLGVPGVSTTMDMVAVAPYFGLYVGHPDHAATVAGWTVDDLFLELNTGSLLNDPIAPSGALAEVAGYLAGQSAALAGSGLPLVAYEGGPSLGGHWLAAPEDLNHDLFREADQDPRMGTMVGDLLDQWRISGGELMMHFNLVHGDMFGNFGLLPSPAATTSAKSQAVCDFIEDNPIWW